MHQLFHHVKRTVILTVLLALPIISSAQNTSIGVKGGYHYVMTKAQIDVLPGSQECGVFTDGNSSGFFGGLTVDYKILGSKLEIAGALIYSSRPASLITQSNDTYEVLDPNTDTYVSLQREHVFTSNLGYIAFEIGLRSQPLESIPLYVRGSFDIGNPIVDATYTQTEEIVSPEGVLFPDDTKRRTIGSGEYPGLTSAFGVTGALGAVFALSDKWEICPEVSYRHGLNSITSTAEWKQSFASAGIQIRYRLGSDEEPAPPPPPPPPPPPEVVEVVEVTPAPPAAVIASVSTVPLEITETIVTQTFPLLPYVFFDSASASLPHRYNVSSSTSRFSELGLPKSTLPIYYHMLDIVGKRMSEDSKAMLVITGTTDGLEANSDAERRELAQARASAIADVMKRRWSISEDQFTIKTRVRPALVSNESYLEGIEENRRVELASTTPDLLGPVVHSQFYEYIPSQPEHEFNIQLLNRNIAGAWNLSVDHNGTRVGSKGGGLAPPERVSFDLNQEMTNKLGPVIGNVDTLDARLEVQQRNDVPASATTRFPLVKTTSNYEVSRLSLIVFDYDRSDISEMNKQMMQRVIQSAVRDGSSATIVGSTDKLGEQDHNMKLSSDRAVAVDRFAQSIAPKLNVEKVEGIGSSTLPYDNSLPEGRFYCRTVSLTITTPLR